MQNNNNILSATPGETKIYGLVRDKNGRPVIDDGESLAPEIFAMLTTSEQEELNNDRFAFRRT